MSYQQVNRSGLRTMVLERLGSASGTFWRTTELNAYIMEALRVFNACTGFWKTRKLAATTANAHWYSLPGTLTSAMRVEFNGVPLQPTSLHDLDYGQPNWESETTGSGGNVPTTVKFWAPAGVTLIAIWPADATGNQGLLYDGIAATPVLDDDADFVDLGQEELGLILDYVQHIATFKEGGKEFEASGELLQRFLAGVAKRNAQLMANAKWRRWMGIHADEQLNPRERNERVGVR